MRSSKGTALVLALIITVVIAILSVVGSQMITSTFKDMLRQQHLSSQADNIARAGLVDAISWFRRQQVQPVSAIGKYSWADGAFDPIKSTDTAISSTLDPSIGLVNEYPLNPTTNLYARYEVARQTSTVVSPYEQNAVHDITGQRLFNGEQNGQGFVWYIASHGIIYRKLSATAKYNEPPNQLVGNSRVSTEIRRISLQIPSPQCGLILMDAGSEANQKYTINQNGVNTGGGSPSDYAFGYAKITPTITASTIKVGKKWVTVYTQTYPTSANPPYQLNGNAQVTAETTNPWVQVTSTPTISYVLGVSTADLKLMADYLVTSTSQLPEVLPDMALIYVDGNAVFSSARELRGSGLLLVNGDLTVSAGSNCYYGGLIYVTGNIVINDAATINGCIIGCGTATLSRSGSSAIAEINYDKFVLDTVRQQVCQYREIKSAYQIFSGISDY
jgi:Tfp pilus assembly protein PilX